MNRFFRVIWNSALGLWQAVSEIAHARGKGRSVTTAASSVVAGILVFSHGVAFAAPLPESGSISAGQGSISQSGTTMNIVQGSDKLIVDWKSFSIDQGHTVNFLQPSATSVALNRVWGSDVSEIRGALNANGMVFLLNPNGVLFSSSAQVNVGGLVASTLALGNNDFLAGNYRFTGTSSNAIINEGSIKAIGNGDGKGTIALIAARISNAGELYAKGGNVLLGAGDDVLLDLGGPVKLEVERGAVDALIANGGAIRADGGTVLLTAKGAGDLAGTVINNSGIIEARTLETGESGKILLLGDMENDRIEVAGTLDASAPAGGNGGFIETSAAQVNTRDGLTVNAGSAKGTGGEWLIDPYDYNITGSAATNITSALNLGTSVTVSTASSNSSYGALGTTNGDITVSSAINKQSGGEATLTLLADRSIIVNSDIGSQSGKLNIKLSAANASSATVGGVNVNGNLNSNGGSILIGGAAGTSTNGIGYALNLDASNAAVVVQQNKSISSNGGNITINGKSLIGSNSGSYSGVKGGVYIKSGASILSGSGNINITGESTAGTKTFGFAVEASSGTLTTIGTSSAGGHLLVNGVNSTTGSGITDTDRANGALGMVNNGSYDRLVFVGPSVADLLVKVNGNIQSTTYTYSPPNSGCSVVYPNCGYLQVPGGNNSYLYAAYSVVNMATKAIYLTTSSGSKVYDTTTAATGLTLSAAGGPTGFSVSDLGTLGFSTSSKNAGTYLQLLNDPANPTTYTSGGTAYAVAYYNGTYTITPKSVTPVAASKVYDGTTAAAVSSNGIYAGDAVTFSYTSGAFASKDVGSNIGVTVSGITLSGLDAANYSLSGSSLNTTANITARAVDLTGSRVYDGSRNVSAGTLALGNLVSGEDLLLSGTGSVADKNANTGKNISLDSLTLSDGGSGKASNYTFVGGSQTVDITKAGLTVSGLTAQNKTYDGTTAATLSGTAALSGVIGSDSVSVDGSAPMTGTFASKDAGTGKSVSASLSGISLAGSDAGNYQVSGFASPLAASIDKATLTVSGLTAQNKTYDGTTAATLSGTAALSGIIASDAVNLTGTTPTSGSFSDRNAGTGKTVTTSLSGLALSGGDANNYQIGGLNAPLTASIDKATLTVSGLAAQNKTYDGTTAATLSGTAALSGVVGSDAVNLSGTTPTSGSFSDRNAGTDKTVTTSLSGLALSGNDASNYQIGGLNAPLTASIDKATLTVSGLTAQNKVYDGTTAATLSGTAALSGIIGSDSVSVDGSAPMTGTFANKDAGTGKSVSASLSGIGLAGSDAGNYQIGGLNAPLMASIDKATLTVSGLTAQNKTYDGTTAATLSGTAALSGIIGSDAVNLTGTTPTSGSFSGRNAGTGKTVTTSLSGLALSGGDANNYQIGGLNAPLTASIDKATLTVSGLTAQNKTYDGTTAATLSGTAALSGIIGSDAVNLTGTTPTSGSFSDRNAGTGKTVTTSLSGLALSGGDAGNYQIGGLNAPLTASIDKATLTVSGLTAQNKVYDGTTAATLSGTAALSGVTGSDAVNLTGTTPTNGSFSDRNAGTGKTVTTSLSGLSLAGNDAGNYQIGGLTSPLLASINPAVSAPRVDTVTPQVIATAQSSSIIRIDPGLGAINNLVYSPVSSMPDSSAQPGSNAATIQPVLSDVTSSSSTSTSDGIEKSSAPANEGKQDAILRLAEGNSGLAGKITQVFVVSGGINIDLGQNVSPLY